MLIRTRFTNAIADFLLKTSTRFLNAKKKIALASVADKLDEFERL